MRLLPLSQWKCDTCGQIIERPEMGWVEWLAGPTRGTKAHAFRIVHNSSHCQYPSMGRVHDIHLIHLLGPDGLATLLELLSPGGRSGNREDGVASLDEWGDLVRRLHVPHFEEHGNIGPMPRQITCSPGWPSTRSTASPRFSTSLPGTARA
jgi:hypothetical protein